MKYMVFLFLFLLNQAVCYAGDRSKAQEALDVFKSLQGKWTTTGKNGEVRSATYQVVASGSAVQETFEMGDSENANMITLFHLNGNDLMLTHYCMAQNQPRMKAISISDDLKEIHFDFMDATNLLSPEQGHMHKAEFRFVDGDTFVSKWTFRENGKDKMVEEDTYKRVK